MTQYRKHLVQAAVGALALAVSCALAIAQNAAPNQKPGAALVERYVAAFNAHDATAFRDVIADNYAQHIHDGPEQMLHDRGLIHCCSSHVRRSWSFCLATHGPGHTSWHV
jgi:hypothetical protein